ncbi:M20/M25/M40 family metallo-hydrolase [Cryobacterium sp. HLT2-28]|uniref:M20/M25/M40 family metallo-hydrolase n=1 Tax=Cryobacterium sp. HLT2-28 TaxID=1259146 RepID=UPI001F53EE73|nr:M20/M25/M40 family metallo-hydrolase [Cryobacterium sp. HLT2-28]
MTDEQSGAWIGVVDDPIDLMRRLIGIDSVNPDLVPGAAGEAEIADRCARWLSGHGFEVHRLEERPGRPSIVAIFRGSGGGRSLMLNGHLDTVGVAGYSGDPFSGERSGGRVLGRGAFDMKGGVAAILVAAARASAAGLSGDVLVTLVADEEFGSLGTMEVLRDFRADAAIVAEPSELCLTLAHRGFAWFELELTGLAAHGSQPERGIDAIAHAGLVLRALDGLREQIEAGPGHPLLGHGTVRVSKIRGGTDAATVAAACTLTIERRTLPGETPDDVEAELQGLLTVIAQRTADFRFRLTRLVARAAFEADPGWPIVRLVRAEAGRVLGHPPATRGEPFWTDAGLLHEAGIPCLVIGVAGGGAHADVEWAEEASVLQLTEILAGTIAGFCA